MLEAVIAPYATTGLDAAGVEEIWSHAYSVYDRLCREADPSFTLEENKRLLQSYMTGPRRAVARKQKRLGKAR